ncbi:MAG: energy-coupling factor ABC transporter ATP-binding protein [Methanobacterium sp.]
MPLVKVENLSYAYPDGPPVLKALDFAVQAGETIAVIGLSGSGKTTLCQCLCGLAPHVLGGSMQGRVFIQGRATTEYRLAQLACEIGMVFQNPDMQLVSTTVEDEIAFAPENLCLPQREIRRRVEEILLLLGLNQLRFKNPALLSGGQRQLLALGAVLALHPEILVLDEPMALLDEKGRQMVRKILFSLRREGKTMIIVDHDIENVDFADRFLLMEQGEIIRLDRPAAVMADTAFLHRHKLFFDSWGMRRPRSRLDAEERRPFGAD